MYHVSHTLSRRENNMKYDRNQNKSQLIEMVFFVFQSRVNSLQINLYYLLDLTCNWNRGIYSHRLIQPMSEPTHCWFACAQSTTYCPEDFIIRSNPVLKSDSHMTQNKHENPYTVPGIASLAYRKGRQHLNCVHLILVSVVWCLQKSSSKRLNCMEIFFQLFNIKCQMWYQDDPFSSLLLCISERQCHHHMLSKSEYWGFVVVVVVWHGIRRNQRKLLSSLSIMQRAW